MVTEVFNFDVESKYRGEFLNEFFSMELLTELIRRNSPNRRFVFKKFEKKKVFAKVIPFQRTNVHKDFLRFLKETKENLKVIRSENAFVVVYDENEFETFIVAGRLD